MRIANYISFILFFTYISISEIAAQDKIIHGTVTTFDSIRVANVEIKIKSSDQIVLTDSLGNFSVWCNNKDVLVFNAHGFFRQRVKLKPITKFVAVNLNLKPGDINKDYALGYGHINDKDKLNAITGLDYQEIDFSKYRDIYDIISGRFSGVRIVNGEVIVRGKNTFDTSVNGALIVVDGITRDERALSDIPTDQVKSIDILKDGGTAIYGLRGANGVVVIETKKGSDRNAE